MGNDRNNGIKMKEQEIIGTAMMDNGWKKVVGVKVTIDNIDFLFSPHLVKDSIDMTIRVTHLNSGMLIINIPVDFLTIYNDYSTKKQTFKKYEELGKEIKPLIIKNHTKIAKDSKIQKKKHEEKYGEMPKTCEYYG